MATMEKRLPLEQTVGELSKGAVAFSAYLSVRFKFERISYEATSLSNRSMHRCWQVTLMT